MRIDDKDRSVVRWAIDRAYPFEYCRANGLPDPCLRIRLGMSHAYFHQGKLVHWTAEAPGQSLDVLLCEMASLFAMCAGERAYLNPRAAVVPPTQLLM